MSRWLDEQDEKLEDLKERTKNNPLIVMGIIIAMSVACLITIAIKSPETLASALRFIIPIVVFQIALIFLINKKKNKKKGDPDLRKMVEKYLTTPEEVELFDREMYGEPRYKVDLEKGKSYLSITDNWIVNRDFYMHEYFVVYKIDQIESIKSFTWKDLNSVTGLGREYNLQILFKDKSEALITVGKKKKWIEVRDNLQKLLPSVEFIGLQ